MRRGATHLARDARRRATFRRRRALCALVVALGGTVIGVAASSGTTGRRSGRASLSSVPASSRLGGSAASRPVAVEAGELPWKLAAPISREVVLPGSTATTLLVAGGLDGSGNSDAGTYALDTTTGHLSPIGTLATATHDAAGVVIGGRDLVLGGGTVAPSATSQRFSPDGASLSSGTLPSARADAVGETIGSTAYVAGGYDGPSFDATVLATTNGLVFTNVANLPVPVRYPAAATLGGEIYLFGGQARDGRPVRAVQVVDPRTRSAKVIGELPIPLSGAVAANIGGTIYIAGGDSAVGAAAPHPVASIFAFDAASTTFLRAGTLPIAVSNGAGTVLGARLWIIGGEVSGGTPTAAVQMLEPNRAFGLAGDPGAGSPFFGDQLLVADRGNDRLMLLNDANEITWTYPSAGKPAPPGGFYFPDDAFFIRHGTAIISNQEENETLVEIAFPSGRTLWQYGHPRTAGSAPGYLHNPDDAYLLRNGDITVADPVNCRMLILDPKTKSVLHQIGTTGSCTHNPPTALGSPNGDTPLADGNILVSEINGNWVDEYTPAAQMVWQCQLPSVGYVSDPQQIGPDRYLVAGYENPGSFVEFNRQCDVLYRYGPTSGSGELNKPSLVEQLPSGVLMANDDYNNRIVAIDPGTGALVWQYGIDGHAGSTPGLLNTPDGFDLLGAGGSTPTHPTTG